MGPLLTAFMIETQKWQVPFWVYFAMNVLALGLVIAFLQETYYDRTIPAAEQPAKGPRWGRLVGTVQWKSRYLRNTFKQACWRTVSVFIKPIILISCLFYALVCFFFFLSPVFSLLFSSPFPFPLSSRIPLFSSRFTLLTLSFPSPPYIYPIQLLGTPLTQETY